MGVKRKSTQGSVRPKEPVAEKLKCADSLDELCSSTRLRAREGAEDRRQRLKRRDIEEQISMVLERPQFGKLSHTQKTNIVDEEGKTLWDRSREMKRKGFHHGQASLTCSV